MSATASDCTIDKFGGKAHDYNYCIKPINQQVGSCEPHGTECISQNMRGLFNYAGSLVYSPGMAISQECSGQLGNKYLQKTGTKCKDILTNNSVDRYKYINNMETTNVITGRSSGGSSGGLIPATISSITKINPVGILSAITEESEPKCKKVKVKCHILNDNNILYNGESEEKHIAIKDIQEISQSNRNNIVEGFSNLNNENKKLDEFYYILITCILLYLIYKLIHKK